MFWYSSCFKEDGGEKREIPSMVVEEIKQSERSAANESK